MDQIVFAAFFDRVCYVICRDFLPGITPSIEIAMPTSPPVCGSTWLQSLRPERSEHLLSY